jgi:hypothetical protein
VLISAGTTDLRLDEPVIILTAGRSGSTLLRHILDAHPDVACSPETNIVKTCAQLASAWRITGAGPPSGGLSAAAAAGLRATVEGSPTAIPSGVQPAEAGVCGLWPRRAWGRHSDDGQRPTALSETRLRGASGDLVGRCGP